VGGEQTVIGDHENVQERLSAREVAAGGLLAASHVHRYELAARVCRGAVLDLCCGTGYGSRVLATTAATVHGVDVAEDAVAAARQELDGSERERMTFEVADALAFLRAQPQGRYDCVVCFEGVEHVPDPEALVTELARLAEAGARLLLSFPNSKGFEEENEFHVTDFGYEEMQALIAPLPEPVVLEQRLAEASVIAPPGWGDERATGRLEPAQDDGAWANHWIVTVNVAEEELSAASARITFAAAPQASAYMRELERVNAELYRTNTKLARGWLGIHDAAAASAHRRVIDMTAEAEKWKQIADNNDWGRRVAEQRLQTRRHRIAEAPYAFVTGLPGVPAALASWRRFRSR
jgi:2-polyprenyl-3-methyl-5-hydroxy-6-metoxy-1,4-benzoquinol methylase